jgi:hypothetical protein
MADEGKLQKKAEGQISLGGAPRRRRRAPKLIIGDVEEASPGQTGVKEQTIQLGNVGKRGGKEGATIGRRPMPSRTLPPGVTAGMGIKGRRRHR